jgi:hypothetical protein
VQAKGMSNIFNKIITEKFQNLEKTMPIDVQEASITPGRLDQNRTNPGHIIIKTKSTESRERILNSIREKKQRTYKGKPIKITADFSMETFKMRIAWSEVFCSLNENNFNPRTLHPAKLSFKKRWSNKILPGEAETKTTCDHKATTRKDYPRNSAHRK